MTDTAGHKHKSPRRAGRWGHTALLVTLPPLLALALLWLGIPLFYPDDLRPTPAGDTLRLKGEDFRAVVARRAERGEDGSLSILDLQPARRNGAWIGEGVFSADTRSGLDAPLPAEAFSQLRLHLEGLHPRQQVLLFWRTTTAPTQQRFIKLENLPNGVSWHTLPADDVWEGQILEVAVGVFGRGKPQALTLHSLTLAGTDRSTLAQRALEEWRRFVPWLQSSTNRYDPGRGATIWEPGAAAALWAGLALLILVTWVLLTRGYRSPRGPVIAGLCSVFLPWLCLDLLWQEQLQQQLTVTRARYAGLDQQAKHQREDDANLQAFAAELQQQLVPLRGKRVFLLNDLDVGHKYHRLRLQFHLLPLNIHNYGRYLLPPGQMRPGDHVLLLEPATTVEFDVVNGLLEDAFFRYRATRLLKHPLGALYRLEPPLPMEGQP